MNLNAHPMQNLHSLLLPSFVSQEKWSEIATSPLAICVGIILFKHSTLENVKIALNNLKQVHLLDVNAMQSAPDAVLQEYIQLTGHSRQKVQNLKMFTQRILHEFGDVDALQTLSDTALREFLLQTKGIGLETCDKMMLHAFARSVFAVDAHTHRILARHRVLERDADYLQVQEYCQRHLPTDVVLYRELQDLMVALGKTHCHKNQPDCANCPLREWNGGFVLEEI